MEYKIADKTNVEEIREFIRIHDRAFLNRKHENNPYTKINEKSFIDKISSDTVTLILALDSSKMIGGLLMTYQKNEGQECMITNVCVDPDCQGKGIARGLLEYAHTKAANDGCRYCRLAVGSVWKNAIILYKRSGYKLTGIGAHIPHTYYLLDFIKPLSTYKYSNIKRIFNLIKSSLVFFVLFKKDSTPRIIHKMIYKS